jgi:hypothetical protein
MGQAIKSREERRQKPKIKPVWGGLISFLKHDPVTMAYAIKNATRINAPAQNRTAF